MRVVIALGGNALLRRGEVPSAEAQRRNVAGAARAVAEVARAHEVVVTHGNGPQVGLLALQGEESTDGSSFPLDVLGAETEGMIGYIVSQELGNEMPDRSVATLLTQVEVDPRDPAFGRPTKPIGPVYARENAERLARERGWQIARDGDGWRRVVPSPEPRRILEIETLRLLVRHGVIVVCAGGGGIPVVFGLDGAVHGVEAVIDKDRTAALLAEELDADALLLLTDVDGVYRDWGGPDERRIERMSAAEVGAFDAPAGSMGPKLEAAAAFATSGGRFAAIGALADAAAVVRGEAGTRIVPS